MYDLDDSLYQDLDIEDEVAIRQFLHQHYKSDRMGTKIECPSEYLMPIALVMKNEIRTQKLPMRFLVNWMDRTIAIVKDKV
jgi:hypothetical protein